MKKAVVAASVLALVAVGALEAHRRGFIRIVNPPVAAYPVRGIDVSRHQGDIDWPSVRRSRIDFVFVKATEGADHRDERFSTNWRGAKGLLARSPYHFFTFCTDGRRQAKHFLATASLEDAELPPAVDVEFAGNCKSWSSLERIRGELKVFIETLEQSLKFKPILYATRGSWGQLIRGSLDDYPLWLREVVRYPSREEYPSLAFWQYAGNGRVPGIRTLVDLNVFVGSRMKFASLVAGAELRIGRGPAAGSFCPSCDVLPGLKA